MKAGKTAVWMGCAVVIGVTLAGCASPAAPIEAIEPTDEMTEEAAEAMTAEPTEAMTPEPTQTPSQEPTATPIPEGVFVPVGTRAIVNAGTTYADPGAVIYHDGTYHMLLNAFDAWPARVDVLHAVSDDGIEWDIASRTPVFNEEGVPYAGIAVLASSVLVEEDGTWVLYFYTVEGVGVTARGTIGRATAPGPDGPFTAGPAPVLEPGAAGSWDSEYVGKPSVIKTAEGYLMWYSGDDEAVGLATSPDGITWTKHPQPVFENASGTTWDSFEVWQPNVVQTPEGFVMLYRATGTAAGTGVPAHGLAFSEDGIHWTRHAENPVLRPNLVRGGQRLWFTNFLYADDTYWLFFEVAKDINSRSTAIYLASQPAPIGE